MDKFYHFLLLIVDKLNLLCVCIQCPVNVMVSIECLPCQTMGLHAYNLLVILLNCKS